MSHEPRKPLPFCQTELERAWSFLQNGEEEKARGIALKWRSRAGDDYREVSGWGDLFYGLGMARRALECYRRSLRLFPRNCEVIMKLAGLLNETGHYDESVSCLKAILRIDPGHPEARRLLSVHYRERRLDGQAEALVPAPGKKNPPPGPRYFPPSAGERELDLFLRLFSGRETGYAVQIIRASDGAVVFEFHENPLTPLLVRPHLRGEITLAAYPLRSDNTVRYAAISVKIRESVQRMHQKSPSRLISLAEKAQNYLLLLAGYAAHHGLSAYPEDCGGFQWRLWFFFDGFFHFLKVKKFLTEFLECAPLADGSLSVEPLLATKPSGLGWEENPVLLPLGIHRATLRRCFFLDSDGEPVGKQLKFLRGIRRISALRPALVARPYGKGTTPEQRISAPQAQVVCRKCAVVRELITTAARGRSLRHEEKLVLFYTAGLVRDGGPALHQVLENCPDYDFDKVSRQIERLKPNPISCLKVRRLLPEISSSVSCDCVFDLRGGKYPSPLLHVSPHLVPAATEMTIPPGMTLRGLAEKYIGLRQHIEETRLALSRLETLLDSGFSKKGLSSIKVGGTLLRRVAEKGQTFWEMEQR